MTQAAAHALPSALRRQVMEHPPLMVKLVAETLCGGSSWSDTMDKAGFLAKSAVAGGFVKSTKEERALLGVDKVINVARAMEKKHHSKKKSSKPKLLSSGSTSSSGSSLLMTSCKDITLQPLNPKEVELPGNTRLLNFDILDCTFGAGYHSQAVLEYGEPMTRVVALDCDYAVAKKAKVVESQYGSERFRFFNNRFSEAKGMFADHCFDGLIVDPGPSFNQLSDPRRGFDLFNLESRSTAAHGGGESNFDWRYGADLGTSALHFMNKGSPKELFNCCQQFGINKKGSGIFANLVQNGRPYTTGQDFIRQMVVGPNQDWKVDFRARFPEELWFDQEPESRWHLSFKWLHAIRAYVNAEQSELSRILDAAPGMVRPGGRIVVVTRHQWEEKMVSEFVQNHPYLLLLFNHPVDPEEVNSFHFNAGIKMWALERTLESTFPLKNSFSLSKEDMAKSQQDRFLGLDSPAYGKKSWPAQNFVVHTHKTTQHKNRHKELPKDDQTGPTSQSKSFWEKDGEDSD